MVCQPHPLCKSATLVFHAASFIISFSFVRRIWPLAGCSDTCKMVQVLIPIANGCEEIEVVTIIDILRRAKVDVVVTSVEKNLQILASQGTKIVADKLITDTLDTIYDLIILPVRKKEVKI